MKIGLPVLPPVGVPTTLPRLAFLKSTAKSSAAENVEPLTSRIIGLSYFGISFGWDIQNGTIESDAIDSRSHFLPHEAYAASYFGVSHDACGMVSVANNIIIICPT